MSDGYVSRFADDAWPDGLDPQTVCITVDAEWAASEVLDDLRRLFDERGSFRNLLLHACGYKALAAMSAPFIPISGRAATPSSSCAPRKATACCSTTPRSFGTCSLKH